MANTMKALQTVTVGAGGAASISFTDIPQTYTDLVLKLSLRDGTSAQSANANIILNSNGSTVYSSRRLYGTGSGVASDSFSNLSSMPGTWVNSATATSSTFANIEFYIPNYAGSNNKSVSIDSVTENNATAAFSGLTAGLFASSSPITSLGISTGSNFVQYSTATLYGVFNQDVSVAPAAPTIGTASDGGTGTSASVAFTGVSGAASYTATSSPGGFTGTAAASPITVTGLTTGTAYTFTVKANNPIGSSAASAASNSVTPIASYSFVGTITSTQNYTIPAGKNLLSLFVASGGGGGSGGQSVPGGTGGGGGAAGALISIVDYPVTPGATYLLTIGAGGNGGVGGSLGNGDWGTSANAGGGTSFSNLLSTNGGPRGFQQQGDYNGGISVNNISSYVTSYGDYSYRSGAGGAGFTNQNGSATAAGNAANFTMNLTGLGTVYSSATAMSGGGGGAPGTNPGNTNPGVRSGGAASGGGTGGNNTSVNTRGNAGASATARASGGGGGSGSNNTGSNSFAGRAGGAGSGGFIDIYVK